MNVAKYRNTLQSRDAWPDEALLRVYFLGLRVRWIFSHGPLDADRFDTCQHERFNEIMRRGITV